MKFKFKLGQVVRDRITGYTGLVYCRTQWLNNCNTYNVKSRELKDGKPMDSVSFDEPTLELVEEKQVLEPQQKTGGPTESVQHRSK